MKNNFLGDALTPRPYSKNPPKFQRTGNNAVSLEGINVATTNNKKPGQYSSTDFPGDTFERMRRFALVLAKYSVPDTGRLAAKWHRSEESIVAANKVISNNAFRHIFGEDATKETVNIAPYVAGFKADATNKNMIISALSFASTQALSDIINEVAKTRPAVADALYQANAEITEWLGYYGAIAANALHSPSARVQRRGIDRYHELASLIDIESGKVSKAGARKKDAKPSNKKPNAKASKHKVIREIDNPNDAWADPFLVKHPLEIPHTGKAGRRLIAWNEGKQPKAFYRQVTDPQRRIFKRKTRALGGVVVFDCSGSMGLTEEEIEQVMNAASGCSILCYSSSGDYDTDRRNGNIHLVARMGRQARHLPHFPGGNGVDLPALKWAYENLRLNSKSPVIWVSDGQVTGRNDHTTEELRTMTNKYIKAKDIKRVDNPAEATRLLSKLQARRKQ
jgi:hypothetical protein